MNEPAKAVFLSYASRDADTARRIADALQAAGVEVWFDQSELVGGDAWDAKIRKQIAECALFIPVISGHTQARLEGYFRLEWKLAAQRTYTMADEKVFLLPVVIDETHDADAKVPAEFKAVQWTRLPGGDTPEKFCARVKRVLNGEVEGGIATHGLAAEPKRAETPKSAARPIRWWTAAALVGALAIMAGVRALRPAREVRDERVVSPAATTLTQVWDLLNQPEMARAELEAAEALCRKAAAVDPTNANVWAAWSSVDTWFVFYGLDRSPERVEAARDYAAKAMRLAPKSFEARLAQALFWVRGDISFLREPDARVLLGELLKERPDEPRALLSLGFSLTSVPERYEEGIALLEQLARNPAFAAVALDEAGWVDFFSGNFTRAQNAADRSLAVRPYWNNLGLQITLALYVQGDPARAQHFLAQMPATMMQEDWGIGFAWKVFLWSREPLRALAAVDSVQRDWVRYFFNDSPRAFLQAVARQAAGQPLAARRDFQRALDQLNRSLADNPNNGWTLTMKAITQRELGDEAGARETYRLVLELGDSLPPLFRGLLKLQFEPPDRAAAFAQSMVREPKALEIMDTLRVEFAPGALRLNPWFDRLRGEPVFQELLGRTAAK